MPNEIDNEPAVDPTADLLDQGAEGAPELDDSQAALTGDNPPGERQPSSRVLQIRESSMARIKEEERTKARKAHQAELDRMAQSYGYRSHADLVAKLERDKAAASQRPRQRASAPQEPELEDTDADDADPPAPAANRSERTPRALARLEREKKAALDALRQANRARNHAERERRRLQQERDAAEAEHELRLAAVRAGVSDVDYAMHLLRSHCAGKSQEELAAFDENAYFATEMRKTHPYLYKVEEQLADTSVTPAGGKGGNAPPKPADPTKPPTGGGDGAPVDVRRMSRTEYEAHLRKRGLTPPGLGMAG